MFDDNLNTTSVPFFIVDFNLLSCEFVWCHFILIKNKLYFAFTTLLQFLVKNSKTVSFTCSAIKNIVVFPCLSKFAELLLDLHLIPAVYLDLLQSIRNFL